EGGVVAARTLLLRWNGSEWRSAPALEVALGGGSLGAPSGSFFTGIGGSSAVDVWAVGGRYVDGRLRPLVQRFDGARWTVAAIPDPVGDATRVFDSYLGAVAAASPADAWAVGFDRNDGEPEGAPLALHWDGRDWHVTPIPRVPGCERARGLHDVSAEPRGTAWLVGACEDRDGHPRAFVLAWDSNQWRVALSAERVGAFTQLSSIAATGDGEVWAVGHRVLGAADDAPGEPLTFRHDPGTGWRAVPPPPSAATYGLRLNAVAVAGPGLAWVVGDTANNPALHDGVSFAMRWDGARWIREPVGQVGETLWGVDVHDGGRALAVGANGKGGHSLIFARHDP
ncbi:MAG TPA: hypothetical protein VJM11_11775, partial [Nevskiaceae bacterium]|nr:hypothetical protein [Nevskiaceae bacterium]